MQHDAYSLFLSRKGTNFTGRVDILAELSAALTAGQVGAWKQALTGLGGTGKSQIAVEYANRHRGDYQFIWWLGSEEPAALAANYAGLASDLNLPEKDSADQTTIIAAVKRWLGENRNWLLVFDNVNIPEDIEHYLPGEGKGHVIITSRNSNWGGVAGEIPIRVFKREESVEFLGRRTKQKNEKDESLLADALGDLPLALEQAGAYIGESAISLADYLKLFQEQRIEILKRGKPVSYPDTIATTWDISFKAVQKESANAIDLLKLLAFLAPDNIPKSLLIKGTSEMPEPLSSVVADGIKFNDSTSALRRYSLISITEDSLSIHRLVQAVLLDRLADDEKKKWADTAIRMVNNAFPTDSEDVRTWPICSLLLPYALSTAKFADELDVAQEVTGQLLNRIGAYLWGRAEFVEAKKNFERALEIYEKIKVQNIPT
jgi:tetratricopeptide (TPR) repeat protein